MQLLHVPSDAEYLALREEILARLDAQADLVNLALVATGALLAFRLSGRQRSNAIIYIQAPVMTLLATAWAFHDFRIGQLGRYVASVFEGVPGGPGWETYLVSGELPAVSAMTGALIFFQALGVFVGSQMVCRIVARILPEFGRSTAATEERARWERASTWLRTLNLWCVFTSGVLICAVGVVSVLLRVIHS